MTPGPFPDFWVGPGDEANMGARAIECGDITICNVYSFEYSTVYQWGETKFTRFETVYVILLNIHKRLLKQRCSSHFLRPEKKKVSTITFPDPSPNPIPNSNP